MMIFAIKSAVVLAALYIPYTMLLRSETFVRLNRVVLLTIMLLALALPLINVPFLAVDLGLKPSIEIGALTVVRDTPAEQSEFSELSVLSTNADQPTDWAHILTLLYIIGVVITLAARTIQLAALLRRITRGCLWTQTESDGTTIYCHAEEIAPFSWFNQIVISQSDYNDCGETILRHERAHVALHHSADMLLAMDIQAVQWFNPFVWLFTDSLQEIHEYEADRQVLAAGTDIRQYQLLLIKKTAGRAWPAFTNSLKSNQLKNRFKMMLQKQSSPWRCARVLYVLPIALAVLSVFATNNTTTQPSTQQEEIATTSPTPIANTHTDDYLVIVDGVPQQDAKLEDINKDDIESITVLKDEDAKKPFVEKYGAKAKSAVILITMKDDRVFDICEEEPVFPGGQTEMFSFLMKNMLYPKDAIEHGAQGRVVVSFVVEKSGKVSSVKAISNNAGDNWKEHTYNIEGVTVTGYGRHTDGSIVTRAERDAIIQQLSAEAIRVISSMPAWTPGKQRGRFVRVKLTLPVTFRLS